MRHIFSLQVKPRNPILVVLCKNSLRHSNFEKNKSTNSFTKIILQPCKPTVSDRSTF